MGDSPDADMRAAVIRSVLFGVIMERYLFAHEPAASVPTGELAPALTDVLNTAFGDALRTATLAAPGPVQPMTTRPESVIPEPVRPGADDSPSSLFARLNDCALRHQALVGRTVRAYGISLPAYDVLAAIREAGEPYRRTTGEVSAAGAVRAGGLTQHADRLEAAGLIRRERDADDRRIVHLCLTREGVELADRVRAVRDAQEEELLAGLGPANRRRLAALLGTLGQTLGAGGPEQ